MERGNVLVIGNSGVGKSTLINAVLGEEIAETSWGKEGTTKELKMYENKEIPFRVIDTVGFEPSPKKLKQAIGAVKKWSNDSAKEGHEDNQINLIWFCVDGTAGKLFQKTMEDLSKATEMWDSVPVIVAITKSYSEPDREKNIDMVNNAFAKQKRYSKNLRKVIPVVADTFVINDDACAPPEGITELIDATNDLMPEGLKAGENDLAKFKLDRKRVMAHSVVGAATAAGVAAGAIPIPFADAALLVPIERGAISALAKIYGISKDEDSKKLVEYIVNAGAVGLAAKAAIGGLKAIPGINLGAGVINAIIAGSLVATIGEGTIFAFEQIYLGKKSVADIEWVKNMMDERLANQFIEAIKTIPEKLNGKFDKDTITQIIKDVFNNSPSISDK